MKVFDQDKVTFITPHGIYCYTVMTFSLKNAGATYQKDIQKCLESQIGKNIEAYVDDVVVKTTNEDDLITDLTQTFGNLRVLLLEAPPGEVSSVFYSASFWASW
jgi:hypothetical protein